MLTPKHPESRLEWILAPEEANKSRQPTLIPQSRKTKGLGERLQAAWGASIRDVVNPLGPYKPALITIPAFASFRSFK